VAAPTAGLHFTPQLLDKLRSQGVETVFVTLHVGLGTFRPVTVDDAESHKMHPEYWELSHDAAEAIGKAKAEGRRVISIGTTAVRLMEQAAAVSVDRKVSPGSGWADIFIYPGYRFQLVDALVTNFHLPKSTLLMLTSALTGRDRLLSAYQEAASQGYRFYSFGDAMLIL
jgi:S-adenosylmethionine:tRNA ribosyltransferase-isomerase